MPMKKEAIKQAKVRHEKFLEMGLIPPPVLHVISHQDTYDVALDKYLKQYPDAKSVWSTQEMVDQIAEEEKQRRLDEKNAEKNAENDEEK